MNAWGRYTVVGFDLALGYVMEPQECLWAALTLLAVANFALLMRVYASR